MRLINKATDLKQRKDLVEAGNKDSRGKGADVIADKACNKLFEFEGKDPEVEKCNMAGRSCKSCEATGKRAGQLKSEVTRGSEKELTEVRLMRLDLVETAGNIFGTPKNDRSLLGSSCAPSSLLRHDDQQSQEARQSMTSNARQQMIKQTRKFAFVEHSNSRLLHNDQLLLWLHQHIVPRHAAFQMFSLPKSSVSKHGVSVFHQKKSKSNPRAATTAISNSSDHNQKQLSQSHASGNKRDQMQ